MRTTVKLLDGKSLVIEPGKDGVNISIRIGAISVGSMLLDAGRTGAVLSGIEHAARAAGLNAPAPLL
jgi:hypothetical protein